MKREAVLGGVVEEIMLDGLGRDFRFYGELGQDQGSQGQARSDETRSRGAEDRGSAVGCQCGCILGRRRASGSVSIHVLGTKTDTATVEQSNRTVEAEGLQMS